MAVYWVEHVLRHGDTRHLQSVSKDMPFYQYYLLDVWFFIASVVFVGISVPLIFMAWLLKKLIARLRKIKIKTN